MLAELWCLWVWNFSLCLCSWWYLRAYLVWSLVVWVVVCVLGWTCCLVLYFVVFGSFVI